MLFMITMNDYISANTSEVYTATAQEEIFVELGGVSRQCNSLIVLLFDHLMALCRQVYVKYLRKVLWIMGILILSSLRWRDFCQNIHSNLRSEPSTLRVLSRKTQEIMYHASLSFLVECIQCGRYLQILFSACDVMFPQNEAASVLGPRRSHECQNFLPVSLQFDERDADL
jgi:hypothetical protein